MSIRSCIAFVLFTFSSTVGVSATTFEYESPVFTETDYWGQVADLGGRNPDGIAARRDGGSLILNLRDDVQANWTYSFDVDLGHSTPYDAGSTSFLTADSLSIGIYREPWRDSAIGSFPRFYDESFEEVTFTTDSAGNIADWMIKFDNRGSGDTLRFTLGTSGDSVNGAYEHDDLVCCGTTATVIQGSFDAGSWTTLSGGLATPQISRFQTRQLATIPQTPLPVPVALLLSGFAALYGMRRLST